jgi:hypothetical protein
MAKRNARPASSTSNRSSTRATSRKSSGAASSVEVVEEADGIGIDLGIIIMTSLVLVTGLVMLDMIFATMDGKGMIM